jgi:hypothetical protein
MARTLILIGLAIVLLGLLWPWLGRLGLGRLPGDIVIERENDSFHSRSSRACSSASCCRSCSGCSIADRM